MEIKNKLDSDQSGDVKGSMVERRGRGKSRNMNRGLVGMDNGGN